MPPLSWIVQAERKSHTAGTNVRAAPSRATYRVALCCALVGVVAGVEVPALAAPSVYIGSAGAIRLTPPHVVHGPVIDGRLDDPVWAEAAVLDSFTHVKPIEGVRDTIGTVCLILYDDQNIYAGFRCKDDPREIQAPIVPRDNIWQGDWVGISLDTWNDHQRSQFFAANAHGIQMDGIDAEGLDSDLAPDFLYTSKARITADGYEVELAIPFKSLRFPSHNPLTFGFNAIRDIQRNGTHMFWAPVTRNINSYNVQLGSLQGIGGVHPGKNIQANPTYTGTRTGEREGNRFRYDPDSRLGLGIKYGLTSSLTADATLSPDFSQIEADAGVIDINERFAIFFPEKRPFFLEGSEIFQSPINVVYTRRIVDPRFGLKLTGKAGGTEIGVIQALDRFDGQPIETLPNSVNPYRDHDALYTIGRARWVVFKDSYVGILGGERRQLETHNRGIGVDGRIRFRDQYSFTFQRLQSWSRERDLGGPIARLDSSAHANLDTALIQQVGKIGSGDATYGELARSSKGLDVGLSVLDISPDYAADMGFIQRNDQIMGKAWLRPRIVAEEGAWFTSIDPGLNYQRTYDHGRNRHVGRLTDETWEPQLEFKLPLNTVIGSSYKRVFTYFNGREFPNQNQFQLWAESERYEAVRGTVTASFGDNVVFEETMPGKYVRLEVTSDLRFSQQLDATLSLNSERVRRRADNLRFADVVIPRLRVAYQFTPELALRTIGEFRSERRYGVGNAVESQERSLSLDFLASYYVRPGTVVYLGYGSLLQGEVARAMAPRHNNLFVKLSYLWQG